MGNMEPCSVYGEITEEVLNHRLVIAMQEHSLTHLCENVSCTVRQMLNHKFVYHRVGDKDGQSFLQGSCPAGIRKLDNMKSLDILMIDCDTGIDRDTVCERIQGAGLFGVVWSTHSNGTHRSVVKRKALERWCGEGCGPADAVAWLQEFKHYEPDILAGATVEVGEEGRFIVDHLPMDKSRVLLVLKETYPITGDADRERWASLYRGVCHHLGDLPYDASCLDTSRLFFLPRHPRESTDHAIIVLGGKLLDLSTITPIAAPATTEFRMRLDPDNPFREAAYSLGISWSGDAPHIKNAVDQYLIDHRLGLQFAELYDMYQPGTKARRNGGRAGVCPWNELHSDPDDDDDTGFWCTDAHPAKSIAYRAACRHTGCASKSHDAFWYASKFCEDHEINITTLQEFTDNE